MKLQKSLLAVAVGMFLCSCSGEKESTDTTISEIEADADNWPDDMYFYQYKASTGKETIKGKIPEGELARARKAKEQTGGLINITLSSESYKQKYEEPADTVEQFVIDYRDPAVMDMDPDSLIKQMEDFAASHDGRL